MDVSVGVGVNVGEGVKVSVAGIAVLVSVEETLVDVLTSAGSEAIPVGLCPVLETLHETVVRIHKMMKYRLLLFILLLYYCLTVELSTIFPPSRIIFQPSAHRIMKPVAMPHLQVGWVQRFPFSAFCSFSSSLMSALSRAMAVALRCELWMLLRT